MKKLLNFRPILIIAISLCLGVATTYFYIRNNYVWSIFLLAIFVVCNALYLFIFLDKEKLKTRLIFISIFLIFFIVGGFGTFNQISTFNKADLDGRIYAVTAKIVSVKEADFGSKIILDNVQIKRENSVKINYKISLNCYGKTSLDVGDIVTFKANLFDKDYIYENSFNVYDIERDIRYYASLSSEEITKVEKQLTVFERINLFIRDALKQGLDEKEFAVGYALLTGDSDFMDYDLISSYRNAGVAHIFAVSGLHIGFLAGVLTFLFKKTNLNGIVKAIIITAMLFFYSGICGFSASSLRASVMTGVSLFALALGKRYDGITAMSLSAILILLVSPLQLLCVGFQLSFMVVFGMTIMSKPIAKLFKFLPYKLASSIGAVISAQLFALPICLYAFGQFSTISVMINLLFIPIVSIIFTLTLVTVVIGGIFSIENVTLFPSNYIFKLVNLCITALDYDIFMVGGFTLGGTVIFYYLTFLILSGFFNLKIKIRTVVCVCMAVISALSVVLINASEKKSIYVHVTYTENISATMISVGNENTLIVSDVSHVYSLSSLSRLISQTGDTLNSVILMGGYTHDVQVFLTKMHYKFRVENLYYYGEKQESVEKICKKSFTWVNLNNFTDNQTIELNKFDITITGEGCVATAKIDDKKICILSKLESVNPNINHLEFDYEVMVCLDRADTILSRYNPKTAISYRYSSIYQNAQKSGNISFKLN